MFMRVFPMVLLMAYINVLPFFRDWQAAQERYIIVSFQTSDLRVVSIQLHCLSSEISIRLM